MATDDSGVRQGRVSSINYAAGTARITYADKDGATTKEVPFVANNEYNMPKVGDLVSLSCTSNGTVAATVSGSTWNHNNRPFEGYAGLYRKEFCNTQNKCFERYDENTGEYLLRVNRLLRRQAAEIYDEATGKVGITAGGDATIKSTGASVGVQAKTGVGINAGTNVTIEAAKDISAEAGGSISIAAGKKWMRSVKGQATDTITGTATENFKGRHVVTVTGSETQTYKALRTINAKGRTLATYTGSVSVTAKALFGLTLKGNATVNCKAKFTQKVDGDYSLTVGGTKISIAASGAVTITAAPSITISSADGDVTIKGVSLLHHTHKDGGQGEPKL